MNGEYKVLEYIHASQRRVSPSHIGPRGVAQTEPKYVTLSSEKTKVCTAEKILDRRDVKAKASQH